MTIAPKGAVTVGTLPALRLQLLALLQPGRRVTVDCAGATEFDVAFVQLLTAARSLAERMGGTVALSRPVPDRLLAILDQGGFADWTTPRAGAAP